MASREEMDLGHERDVKLIDGAASSAYEYSNSSAGTQTERDIALAASSIVSALSVLLQGMNNVRLAQQETTDEIRALRASLGIEAHMRRSNDEQG